MFYTLFAENSQYLFGAENLFRYVSFRAGGALLTSFFLSLILGKIFIKFLKKVEGKGQPIREAGAGPKSHLSKAGTPTMGGLMMMAIFSVSTLLWSNVNNPFVWIILFLGLSFCGIGFYDDFCKIKKQSAYALSKRFRIGAEILLSIIAILLIEKYLPVGLGSSITFPFFKNFVLDYGLWLFIPFAIFVIIGSANAVNITDGLDGLATLTTINIASVLLVISYIVGRFDYSMYLHFSHIFGASELTVLTASLIGSLFGFLWYNAKPAQVFMGDTGSLAIGAILAGIAIIIKSEFVFAIASLVLIVETISSALQIIFINKFGRKIFLMAPLHHHFELKGMSEEKVVMRFWIASIVCALIALSTLKIR
ncbi:MAG: phospho-N-acetylmuramoyl-pentapeptide-transferase [Rickettsiales bacterium]|jgi:phospho-N-acetylmuramoyl-pentapeptide-transferase|nr:phospho-N-acetylmuramoyl-pentapeptide-transferase [Rickettsiales bacterium]